MDTKFFLSALFVVLFIANAHAQSWKPLGPDTGRISLINGYDHQPAIATDTAGVPYVVYTEHDSLRIRVKKFDGTNWVDVGTPSYNFRGRVPSIFITQKDSIYVGYIGITDSARCRVIKFDGTDWAMVGGPINAVAGSLYETSLAVDSNDKIFFGYANFNNVGSGDMFANIVSYDGINWTPVGNTGFMKFTNRISLRINRQNNELYAGYRTGAGFESRVSKWNGINWDTVGPAQPSFLYNIDIAPDGTLYLMHSTTVTVDKLVNNSWVQVGTTGIGLGSYVWQVVTDGNGIPYIVFSGSPGGPPGLRVSVKKYDGSSWKFLGSSNFSATTAMDIHLAFGKGVPFITYSTNDTWNRKVYSMYYDEPLNVSLLPSPNNNSVQLYPNPSDGRDIHIEGLTPSNYHVRLVNGLGQLLYENSVGYESGKASLKLILDAQLSSGMYYLYLNNGREYYSLPLVVNAK